MLSNDVVEDEDLEVKPIHSCLKGNNRETQTPAGKWHSLCLFFLNSTHNEHVPTLLIDFANVQKFESSALFLHSIV